jgi:hypothetical protein
VDQKVEVKVPLASPASRPLALAVIKSLSEGSEGTEGLEASPDVARELICCCKVATVQKLGSGLRFLAKNDNIASFPRRGR